MSTVRIAAAAGELDHCFEVRQLRVNANPLGSWRNRRSQG
jgi:hypothetical protein